MSVLTRTSLVFAFGFVACSAPPRAPTSVKTPIRVPNVAPHIEPKKAPVPPEKVSNADPSPAETTDSRSDNPAVPPALPRSPEEAFCHGRPHCSIAQRVGEPLRKNGFIHSLERVVLVTPEEERHPKDESTQGSCSVEEYWFLKTDESGTLVDYQLLTGGCTGDDADEIWCGRAPSVTVEVVGAEVRADWYSPFGQCWSAFSSSGSFTASLEDFQRHSVQSSTRHSLAGYSNGSKWNWETRVGSNSFEFSDFSLDGSPLDPDRCPDVDVEVRAIPSFATSREFTDGDWKTVDLKGCSTSFEPATRSSESGKRATELHAFVGSDGILYLQLNPVSPPSSEAFFEVCLGDETLNDSGYCQYPVGETCARVSITGKVVQGELEVEKAPDALRYAIDTVELASVRLTYRDPKSGAGIWSSPPGVPKRFSYSPLLTEDTEKAECVSHEGTTKIIRHRPPRDEPLSNWAG